jgi:outer membrane biogenesis lipoprotein LolB
LFLSACATRTLNLPTDPGTPLRDHEQVLASLTAACRGVRTLTAALGLSGRAGDDRLNGRVIAGFERPAAIRLEGVGAFGQVGFILAARGDDAVLLLPREERVVRGARAEQILGRLVGVALAPADLLAILTGCVVPAPKATAASIHGNGWASFTLDGGATLYASQVAGAWRLRAARREGWTVEYPEWQGTFPGAVRLRSSDPPVDLTATVSELETNVDIDAAAFRVEVPRDTITISVDELRAVGPLREPSGQ